MRSLSSLGVIGGRLSRHNPERLAQERAKLDPAHEQKMAEEGFSMERDGWPEY